MNATIYGEITLDFDAIEGGGAVPAQYRHPCHH
jgi:hypothetical protein